METINKSLINSFNNSPNIKKEWYNSLEPFNMA